MAVFFLGGLVLICLPPSESRGLSPDSSLRASCAGRNIRRGSANENAPLYRSRRVEFLAPSHTRSRLLWVMHATSAGQGHKGAHKSCLFTGVRIPVGAHDRTSKRREPAYKESTREFMYSSSTHSMNARPACWGSAYVRSSELSDLIISLKLQHMPWGPQARGHRGVCDWYLILVWVPGARGGGGCMPPLPHTYMYTRRCAAVLCRALTAIVDLTVACVERLS